MLRFLKLMGVRHQAGAALLVAAGVLLASGAIAALPGLESADRRPVQLQPAAELPPLTQTAGKISAIDAERNVIIVSGEKGPVPIQIDQSTTIFVLGRTGNVADLDEGQVVRATWEIRAGRSVAQWIELAP